MALIGKRVYIKKGLNRGAFGTITHADREAFRLVTDDGYAVYDRFENMVRAKETKAWVR